MVILALAVALVGEREVAAGAVVLLWMLKAQEIVVVVEEADPNMRQSVAAHLRLAAEPAQQLLAYQAAAPSDVRRVHRMNRLPKLASCNYTSGSSSIPRSHLSTPFLSSSLIVENASPGMSILLPWIPSLTPIPILGPRMKRNGCACALTLRCC